MGTTRQYVAAAVEKAQAELALLSPEAKVALHLSGHGLPTDRCGDYDCGADAYHRFSADLFARTKPAVEAAAGRPVGVFHVYGDGGEGESDPGDEVDGPLEALAARQAEGYTHVVDIPYEFDSNSRDTLIVLREGYGREAPDWNRAWESHFAHDGIQVKIANANGGEALKTDALYAVTTQALAGWAEPVTATGVSPASPHGGHDSGGHVVQTAPTKNGGGNHRHATAVPASAEHVSHGEPAEPVSQRDHGHDEEAAIGAAHAHNPGGGGTGTAVLLALVGGLALGGGAVASRRPVAARVVAVGLGVQLLGLAWDVVIHADAGEGVHLLENEGHWLALAGIIVVGGATGAALLARRPGSPSPVTDS
jgi:hypothetical protein